MYTILSENTDPVQTLSLFTYVVTLVVVLVLRFVKVVGVFRKSEGKISQGER